MSDSDDQAKLDTGDAVRNSVLTEAKPLVFISHDSRDAELAEGFEDLLRDISGGMLKSFRSSDRKGSAGIDFGSEWYRDVMRKIGEATDVVALLTQRSIDRPWILYESGVAKGKLNTTVLGLAIDVPLSEVAKGPFAQFQNCGDDADSVTKLVLQLLRRLPGADPREETVRRRVEEFLQDLPNQTPPGSPAKESSVEPPVVTLFEEIKILVRSIPDEVAQQISDQSTRFDPSSTGTVVSPSDPLSVANLFRGGDIKSLRESESLSGDSDDDNSPNWTNLSSNGAHESIEGEWAGRWSPSADRWRAGRAMLCACGDYVTLLFDNRFQDDPCLIVAFREGNRLFGRWISLSRPVNSTAWVGLIVDNSRIDGVWTGGRWDFRR